MSDVAHSAFCSVCQAVNPRQQTQRAVSCPRKPAPRRLCHPCAAMTHGHGICRCALRCFLPAGKLAIVAAGQCCAVRERAKQAGARPPPHAHGNLQGALEVPLLVVDVRQLVYICTAQHRLRQCASKRTRRGVWVRGVRQGGRARAGRRRTRVLGARQADNLFAKKCRRREHVHVLRRAHVPAHRRTRRAR